MCCKNVNKIDRCLFHIDSDAVDFSEDVVVEYLAPAVGMAQQPSASTLKLTDTILNLTYLTGGVAIVSIIVGEVVKGIRNKRDAK